MFTRLKNKLNNIAESPATYVIITVAAAGAIALTYAKYESARTNVYAREMTIRTADLADVSQRLLDKILNDLPEN